MKKTFVVVVLSMALLSSFTVFASAEFTSSDSDHLTDIWRQLTGVSSYDGIYDWIKNLNTNVTTLKNAFSDTRQSVNPIAYYAQQIYNKMGDSSSYDYSTVLSNIKDDTNNISARSTDLLSKLQEVYLRQGQVQVAITDHIDSASARNHSDWDFLFNTVLFPGDPAATSSPTGYTRYPYVAPGSTLSSRQFVSFGRLVLLYGNNLVNDNQLFGHSPTLYSLIHQLQKVLASDDDLKLKEDNKANEDAATDAFVNGSSSKTSLGAGDIGNLKDVGGSFNDLTSLNGQSSVSSFLDGLTSADRTGQGWFSEATRASLDAVSTPVTTTRLVRKHWRGEKSLTYSLSDDTSVNVVRSPSPARVPATDPDPYNMSGFEANYNWLWGDVS